MSALVPFNLSTIGFVSPTSWAAVKIDYVKTSHFKIPPKIFTKKDYDAIEKEDTDLICNDFGSKYAIHSCSKLSDLIYLFKNLGFTDVYLVDPACKGFWNEDYKTDKESDEILEREIFKKQKIMQQLTPENKSISIKSMSKSASKRKSASKSKRSQRKSPKLPTPSSSPIQKIESVKGKWIRNIFYYEDEENPNKLKNPDWNSKDGVPTKYGYVHSLQEFFKKRQICIDKGDDDICNSFNPKNKDYKDYYNEYMFDTYQVSENFRRKYIEQIKRREYDKIPDNDPTIKFYYEK